MNAKAKLLQFMAIFTVALLLALPAVATKVGGYTGGCYRQGSMWYCARYDNASFYSSCAGTVPAPHLNLEVYAGTSGKFTSSALQNWHIGWKTFVSKTTGKTAQCIVAYEARQGACHEICYDKKTGQAGDVLSRIGFPSAMKYDYDVSKEFQKLYINNGTSPIVKTISTAVGIFFVAAATTTVVSLIAATIILSVGK